MSAYTVPAVLRLPGLATATPDRDEPGEGYSAAWSDYTVTIPARGGDGTRVEIIASLTVYPNGDVLALKGAFLRTTKGRATWNALHLAITGEAPAWNAALARSPRGWAQ